jgi:hypothetical protein
MILHLPWNRNQIDYKTGHLEKLDAATENHSLYTRPYSDQACMAKFNGTKVYQREVILDKADTPPSQQSGIMGNKCRQSSGASDPPTNE